MKLALVFGMRLFAGRPPREMVEIARIADELGFDYVCLAEHVLMHGQPDLAAHTFGPPRHSPDELMPEPLTTLAEEYAALNVPFEARGQRLDETLRACKAL